MDRNFSDINAVRFTQIEKFYVESPPFDVEVAEEKFGWRLCEKFEPTLGVLDGMNVADVFDKEVESSHENGSEERSLGDGLFG